MSKNVYPPSCFSGNCGFCENCDKLPKIIADKPKELELKERCKVLSKFLKSDINQLSENYRNSINQINYREKMGIYNRASEYFRGILPDEIQVNECSHIKDNYNKYIKLNRPHTKICDEPYCKAIYMSTPEYFQKSWYPNVPIYERATDTQLYLCHNCISKQK